MLWAVKSHAFSAEQNSRTHRSIVECAKGLDDATIIVKEHPNAAARFEPIMRKELEPAGDRIVIVPKDADTNALLFYSDLLISAESTTISEAAATGKPAIVFEFRDDLADSRYVRAGVAVGVCREEELVPAIRRLLRDDSALAACRPAFVEKYLFAVDGRAAERVVNHVIRLLKGRQDPVNAAPHTKS